MVFETAIVAALIAAVAALIAARHTSQSTSRQSKRDKKAEFLFRRAEMGHSRKLELYARAFEITGKLSKHILLVKNSAIPKRYFDEVKDDLLDWENKCGAIFTDDTLRAYRALLLALSAPAKSDGQMSRGAKNEVWRKRAWLRGCLKAELTGTDKALLALDEE